MASTPGRLFFASDPILVAEFTTDGEGSAVVAFDVPTDAHDGDHRIILETDAGDHLEAAVAVSGTQNTALQVIGMSVTSSNEGGGGDNTDGGSGGTGNTPADGGETDPSNRPGWAGSLGSLFGR